MKKQEVKQILTQRYAGRLTQDLSIIDIVLDAIELSEKSTGLIMIDENKKSKPVKLCPICYKPRKTMYLSCPHCNDSQIF